MRREEALKEGLKKKGVRTDKTPFEKRKGAGKQGKRKGRREEKEKGKEEETEEGGKMRSGNSVRHVRVFRCLSVDRGWNGYESIKKEGKMESHRSQAPAERRKDK